MKRRTTGQVRIIGGQWRGRRLDVVEVPGLRPSPDRLRETLFNWLGPRLPGAHCLDLFAGSGALGLEAASRGAASVTLVEQDARAVAGLRASIANLDAQDRVSLVQGDALVDPVITARRWDIVFVDPPFADGLQGAVLTRLLAGCLASEACVHLECAVHDEVQIPTNYTVLRDKRFGDVRARLLTPG